MLNSSQIKKYSILKISYCYFCNSKPYLSFSYMIRREKPGKNHLRIKFNRLCKQEQNRVLNQVKKIVGI